MAFGALQSRAPHESHPPLGHLMLLVFEAVMEVVCVSLPGYIVARQGMFDADKQKFVANLNVALFTPCLSMFDKHCVLALLIWTVFTKLASQLTADKLPELAVIPVIFVLQTLVSYIVSVGVSKAFGFKKKQANFVTAMGVSTNLNCQSYSS
jgi:predicted permease